MLGALSRAKAWLASPLGQRALGFWLAGLLNNSNYVIMNAGAKHLSAGGVGVVYLANIAPSVLVKGSAAFWFHLVSYEQRVLACACMMVTCVSMVGLSDDLTIQILGVAVGAFASAMGECTFLAFSSKGAGQDGHGDLQKISLTAWSSGTGMAGVFGYFFVFFFTELLGWSFSACALAANSLAVAWLVNFATLLSSRDRDLVAVAMSEEDDIAGQAYETSLQDGGSDRSLSFEQREHHALEDRVPSSSSLSSSQSPPSSPRNSEMEYKFIELSSSSSGVLSCQDRAMILLRLRDYTLPLFVVYVAEYTLQSGCWAAIGFPIEDKSSRDQFYLYSNWLYQVGVFVSRSSGMLFTISKRQLWAMPALQATLLAFFLVDGVAHFWWNWSLVSLAVLVGLLGGAVYVHAFILISQVTKPSQRETALAAASLADTFGIMLSNVLGIMVQGCLYGINGITDQGRPPTFRCGYDY